MHNKHIVQQEKELLRQRLALSDLAESVRTAMGQLSSMELVFLEDHITELRADLAPAWKQLNWTSLLIDRFLAKAKAAFNKFFAVLCTVKKAVAKMETNLKCIGNISLFHSSISYTKPPRVESFKVY